MQEHLLAIQQREGTGKERAKKLRRDGLIPAVIYGYKGSRSVSVRASDFSRMFDAVSEHAILTLYSDGKKDTEVIVKDLQIDPVKRNVIHVDFLEFERGKVLKTETSIHVEGTAEGVKLGGILEVFITELEIECLPTDIPEAITVNVEELEIGDSIHVRDLQVSDKVKVLTNPDQVVVAVGMPTRVEEEKPEEEEEEEAAAAEEAAVEGEESEQAEEEGE
jgi:large subunit ribosomal protein L25